MSDISRQYGGQSESTRPRKTESSKPGFKVNGPIVEYTETNELGLNNTIQFASMDAIRRIEAICNTQNLAIKRLQARLAKAESFIDKQQKQISDLKQKLDQKMDRF